MKKKTFFAGIALAGGAAIAYKLLNDSVNNIPEYEKRKKTKYVYENKYTNITIKENYENIILLPSDDENIQIFCYESANYSYNIDEIDDTLSIFANATENTLEKLKDTLRKDRHILEIYIPKNSNSSLSIISTNGCVSVEKINFENLNIISQNGAIKVVDSTINNCCAVNNSNGVINIENIISNSLTIVNNNGATIVYNVEGDENIRIDSKNGKIAGFGVITNGILNMSNRNGGISVKDIEFIDSSNIENRNGKIDIGFVGSEDEYALNCLYEKNECTQTGNKDGKQINVSNKNGKIEVSFE